jgi:hypothetical protein
MVTGRCLCGAVRWSAAQPPKAVHHCHCGMCRRWTGEPVAYRASPIALRTHCGACGTALSLAYDARDDIALTVGSMDAPASVVPTHHYGVEGRLPWADIGAGLPAKPTREHW